MGRAFSLAWLRVVREPGRTALGMLGVMAIGALLFDMLLLSHGLIVSFRDRLDQSGFDVRAAATDSTPFTGPRIEHAGAIASDIASDPAVAAVQLLEAGSAEVAGDPSNGRVSIYGVDAHRSPAWTLVRGAGMPAAPSDPPSLVVNQAMAARFGLAPGATISLRGHCGDDAAEQMPLSMRVAGVGAFPNDPAGALTAGVSLDTLGSLCGEASVDRADMILIRSSAAHGGPDAAAAAVRARFPDLHVVTNAELVERFGRVEFSYFRQISSVLTVVTLFFGLLLIAVLLTVSVNQRLGEIAGLRALGLSRGRVMAGVFWESVLLIGGGGMAAVPVGELLSRWLDAILRSFPGVPADAHFFVFEPRALGLYAALMAAAALLAALYPMRLVSALPIAATLRREVVS